MWCAVAVGVEGAAQAAGYSRVDVDAWLKLPSPSPAPAAGTVLSQTDLEAVRGLIAPGYFDYANFPGIQLEIEATSDYQPHSVDQVRPGSKAIVRSSIQPVT